MTEVNWQWGHISPLESTSEKSYPNYFEKSAGSFLLLTDVDFFNHLKTPAVRADTCQRGNRLWHIGFYHSPSSPSFPPPIARSFFFCSVELFQLLQLFAVIHSYSSCSTVTEGKPCLICAVILKKWKQGLWETNLYADGGNFLEPLHIAIGTYSEMMSQSKKSCITYIT